MAQAQMTAEEREREEAKRIILAIVQEAGGTLAGRTRLYKVFYHAHLFYWQDHEGVLTTHPVVHMPNGPGIDKGEAILGELVAAGLLCAAKRPKGRYGEWVYTLPGGRPVKTTKAEQDAIRNALIRVGSGTAVGISKRSHKESPTWRATRNGNEQNIYLDLLSTEERAQLRKRQRDARKLLTAAGF